VVLLEADLSTDGLGKRKAYAMELKEAGTEAFQAQYYAADLVHYDEGANRMLAFDSLTDDEKQLVVALLNNCAMVRLKMVPGDAKHAFSARFDSCKALEYDKDNVKATYRLAQAELALCNFSACIASAERLLELDPENKEAAQLRRKGRAAMKSTQDKEKTQCSKMFG